MSTDLQNALDRVAWRFRRARLWSGLAVCWLCATLVAVFLLAVFRQTPPPSEGAWARLGLLVGLAALAGLATALAARRSARDRRWVACRIEERHPELGTGLLAAIEEDETNPTGPRGFLQASVIRAALNHRRSHNWEEIVPSRTLDRLRLAHGAALGLFLLALGSLGMTIVPRSGSQATARASAGAAYSVKVEPGNTDLEKGTSLLVVARFDGPVPPEARLVLDQGGDKETSAERPLARSLEDPTFAGRVENVESDLTYHVEFAGRSSERYRVKVFEYPELRRADANLVFPGYTGQKPRKVDDVRHVTAVEGTDLTLQVRLNKDVPEARLVDEKGTALELRPDPKGGSHAYATTLKLADSHRYKLQLRDADGRAAKQPAEIAVNVTRNRLPTVALAQPGHDVRVSPVEELSLRAKLDDDFGITRHGLTYTIAGSEPRDLELKPGSPPSKRVEADHLLDFESLKAAPDQLVTYFFWAEDIGPDEKPRRTSGDMFFAEVRHFEEIFRQGEQPSAESAENENQQQQGNARQAEQLAERQKEVINATWKILRRETGTKLSEKFADDVKLVADSQKAVMEEAEGLSERLRDETSKSSLARALSAMNDAATRLTDAATTGSVKPLTSALAAEQAAYQALLKLRAREFEVVRQNQRQRSQSGRNSGGPSQRQLNQLELKDDENRFEEQRTARSQEQLTQREQEQRENRQILNRLKELAQRQGDLNERLKEMQAALEAAKDPQTRDEIERQLKRLREQEQQLLRDTDELRERMENEQNRERMAEARQQVEQSRERLREASEALEQGRLSQALTEGTRANRELNDLREQFRKENSGQFNETLTQMRDQARSIDEKQKAINQRLDGPDADGQKRLRDQSDRTRARQELGEQRKAVDSLLQRMRDTVQEAEESEPLLAKELFDTVRKAGEPSVTDDLNAAEQLAEAGVTDEATRASRRAGEGIEQMRQGVERAARSILGDETAALRRARGELEDLAEQVGREINQGRGQEAEADAAPSDPNRPQGESAPNTSRESGSNAQGPERNEANAPPREPAVATRREGRPRRGDPPNAARDGKTGNLSPAATEPPNKANA
ncbi:MAG: DUF4175 family protein [Isosphaeraceae bacterium]